MSPRVQHPGPDYRALLQLLRTAEALWNGSRIFFDRWKLSPSQFNVLNLLFGKDRGLSQIELSRQLIMHRSNVTGLIDRLEARKLVERKDQAGDRRAYRVELSSDGRRLVAEILPHYYRAAKGIWRGIPPAHIKQLTGQLQKVTTNVDSLSKEIRK